MRSEHSVTTLPAVIDGVLYVVGGQSGDTMLATNESFSFEQNVWVEKQPMLTARGLHAVATNEGKIFAIGGCSDNTCATFLDAVEMYDPEDNSWIPKQNMLQKRRNFAAATFNG